MTYHWLRTKDHPAATARFPELGERSWNVYFDADDGRSYCVHVGPESRVAMLKMLADDAVKEVTPELLAQL